MHVRCNAESDDGRHRIDIDAAAARRPDAGAASPRRAEYNVGLRRATAAPPPASG
ncbi:hypothetical protein A33K_18541 [Burkholderia humptydooensis MSMB43]|uniref:Uncharacterized protein n=1 Tax=Burkholderia humptydooensis MSMB43 TaxID=441157 RepID=A0ABN0FY88_9BURK|nr:hypothetical protein A33K_18541 [Burkholderia humptydooensis MSMB43]